MIYAAIPAATSVLLFFMCALCLLAQDTQSTQSSTPGDYRIRVTSDLVLTNVVVRDKERQWTIRADEGDVFQREGKRRDVEVRNNVVVTTDDGVQLETTVLRWDSEEHRLWTDAPVKLMRQGSVVEGTSFDLRMNEDNATVNGRVRATFLASKRR